MTTTAWYLLLIVLTKRILLLFEDLLAVSIYKGCLAKRLSKHANASQM